MWGFLPSHRVGKLWQLRAGVPPFVARRDAELGTSLNCPSSTEITHDLLGKNTDDLA